MTPTPAQLALWANNVQRECLLSCGDDVESGLAAAEYIVSTQQYQPSTHIPLAFDIFNRKAQGILNRYIRDANKIVRAARKELINSIEKTKNDNGTSLIESVNKYHNELSKLIVDVQLTSLLAGAKQVATKARMSDEEILSPEDLQILTAAAQQKAHTIASVDTQETISRIREVLVKNIKEPTDDETFQQSILDAVEQGTFLSEPHLETILRANVQSAFSEGQMSFLSRHDVQERFPYVKYEAIKDNRVRDSHESLDTKGIQGTNIYRADDPVFKTFRPPWDFNCRCSWRPLTIADAAAEGITEAEDWMLNGVEPAGTYVSQPGFSPPTNFHRDLASYPLSIQLSVKDSLLFSTDKLGHLHRGKGPKGGQFISKNEENTEELESKSRVRASYDKLMEYKEKLERQATKIIDKIPGGKYVREKLASIKEGITERYGLKTTALIIGSGVALAWTAQGIAAATLVATGPTLLHGLAFAPGISLVGMLPALCLAELHHQLSNNEEEIDNSELNVAASIDSNEELSREEIDDIAKKIVDYLINIANKTEDSESDNEEITLSNWINEPGPRSQHRWRNTVTGKVVYQINQPGERHGRTDDDIPPANSGRVEGETEESSTPTISKRGKGKGIGSGTRSSQLTKSTTGQPLTPDQQRQLGDVFKRIESHASTFRRAGYDDVADWFTSLIDHIKKNGLESIATMLGESKGDISAPTSKVEYKGTGYFAEDAPKDVQFLKKYLDNAGIIFLTESERVSGKRQSILTAPLQTDKKQAKGSFRAVDTNLQTKLEESKLLPGLESSEDIEVIMGKPVKAVTNKVMAKLDEVYGKGKWLIKSYGDESYAGFGILFPQRIKEIKRAAKQVIAESDKKLNKLGYSLNRGEFKNITGVKDSKGNRYDFHTPEYAELDKKVRKLAKSAMMASPDERGARLPINYEDSLEQDYGINLRRNEQGKIIGIVTPDGEEIDFKTKEYKKFLENNDYEVGIEGITAHHIDRAITSATLGAGTVRFMVQPAFQAVGVTAADRALGNTWETSTEGRVHVITQGGKASVVPYATLAARYDVMPVVFHNDDTRAMEKAVQDAIDALPESERAGQVYAPDVIKTKDGWRVVELNAASDFGQSMWLEENPLVIDSVVSHLTGREPSHVRFIRGLINDKLGRSESSSSGILPEFQGKNKPNKTQPQPSTKTEQTNEPEFITHKTSGKFAIDATGHEHKGKGPGGGQFVSKGKGGSKSKSLDRKTLRTNRGEEATTDKLGHRLNSEKKNRPKKTKPELIGKVVDIITLNRNRVRYDPKKHREAIERAKEKAANNPAPTPEEVEYNQAKIAEMGAWSFRRGLVGNSTDRKNRRIKLLNEFGDGKTCNCVYCGIQITHGTMEQDKIYTTAQGGRYRIANIVPACSSCNKERSDAPFDEAIEMAEAYYAKRTAKQ